MKSTLSVNKSTNNRLLVNEYVDQNMSNGDFFDQKPICEYCNKLFKPKRKDSIYCTKSCSQAAWYRRKLLEDLGVAERPICLSGSFRTYAPAYRKKIDVIITDPPYGRDFLPLYKELADFAMTTLVPGGWLLCLSGWGLLWDIGSIFNKTRLEYITVCTYLMPNISPLKAEKRLSTGLRKFQQKAKPLLWYQKPGSKLDRRRAGTTDLARAHFNTCDMCGSSETFEGTNVLDRQAFHWQQCLEGFKQIAWIFANPQDVICDPCMGSGTTLVAAYLQNRKHVIGIEKDYETYKYAVQRVEAAEAGTLELQDQERPHE